MSREDVRGRTLAATFMLLPILGVAAPLGIVPLSLAAAVILVVAGDPRALWSQLAPAPLIALAMALAWIVVSSLWSPAPAKSLFAAGQLAGECVAGVIVIAGVLALDSTQRERLGLALALGIVIAAVLLWFEIATGASLQPLLRRAPGRDAPIEVYNRGATTLAIFLWPALTAVHQRWGKLPAAFVIIVVIAAIGLLLSATAQLAIIAGAAAYLVARWLPRLVKPSLAAGAIGLAALPLMVLSLPPVGQIAASTPTISHSGLHRLVIWRFVSERIAERPLFGWGFDSARAIENSHREVVVPLSRPDAQGRTELRFYELLPLHPHSMSLQIWLEIGMVGVVLIFAVVWLGLRPALSEIGAASAALAPAFAALAASLVVASLGYGIWQGWWMSSLWLVAAILALRSRPASAPRMQASREAAAEAAAAP